jgi:methionine synthase II (cobalamin-independent)
MELPTTTIGSFPQTEQVRSTRAQYRKGKISQNEYEAFLEEETARVVRWQEQIGLDVLVHGEFERTDMVEYFGEQLSGFTFTENGKAAWGEYLRWSVDAFKLATSGAADSTQIHTHMCYCEFNDFVEPIAALDADVISIVRATDL